ncbi:general substrate transporter [Microstroma glucosiphilum]|uniref:General substrate transporter n=1 Tax=Pseudomicrostroma glucosiphilum TaxID=1684307 RepID=A0A316UA29_9BASI|nr:general substrate transporter [Pseudomicrostroma glucosiphilum]PWN22107.1 general substrate transporter [Pseudomicrostroma glucosiphilum]
MDDKQTKSVDGKDDVAYLTRDMSSDAESPIDIIPDVKHANRDAAGGDSDEREGTLWENIQRNRPACFWALFISLCLVMEGYDLGATNSFFGLDEYKQKFGQLNSDGTKSVSAVWQTGVSNASYSGQFIGLCIGGYLVEKIGYRRVSMGGMAWISAVWFIVFFAPSIVVVAVGEGLIGMGLGIFQSLTTAYASEILPVSLRGYLTSWSCAGWGIGLILAATIVRGGLDIEGTWAYKMPWVLVWVWPPILGLGCYFAPESPWWLSRKGRDEDAKRSLARLNTGPADEARIERSLALIKYTNMLEEEEVKGTTFLDCFRGVNLRRTELCALVFCIQIWSGAPMNSFAVVFLQQAGVDERRSFDFGVGINAMFLVGTLLSWTYLSRLGRKTIYLIGLTIMAVIALLVGVLGVVPHSDAVALGAGALCTIGPLCYTIIAEIASTRLRAKTIALARAAYTLSNIITNILQPRMISESAWGWGAKCGWFWFGFCILTIIYTYFRIPETKDRSYAEIDILFNNKVSARKFKSTKLDAFALSKDHH